MKRRNFFNILNPFQRIGTPDSGAEAEDVAGRTRDELFLLAMAQGIDPATVDPARLSDIVRVKASDSSKPGR